MSASERLKALGERAVADRYQTIDQLREKYGGDWPAKSSEAQSLVYAALPQIVAVVEAAEMAMHTDVWINDNPMHGPTLTAGGGTTKTQIWDDLRAALAALEKELS